MPRRLPLLACAGVLVLAAAAGALLLLGDDETDRRPERPQSAASTLPDPRDFALRVVPGHSVLLRDSPSGRVIRRVDDTTEFGSTEVLSPTGRRVGDWLAVRHTSLGNDGVAWISASRSRLSYGRRHVRLEVDLSKREATFFLEERLQQRIPVAVGAPDTPTPPGEYYVTDKLRGADFGPYYGCCILALSGRQPNLPRGWSGGDRLAIHGSPTPTWGQAVSNGCLHASLRNLRYLMKTVPLGAVVTVRS